MESRFFALYQVAGWTLVYVSILLSLYLSGVFTNWELLFGGVLVGSSAFYAHLIRLGYKRWFTNKALAVQTLYFIGQAFVGASLATLLLIIVVVILSKTGYINPIAKHQFWMMINAVFWGNAINMFVALIAWSAIYLSLVRARELKRVSQTLATSQLQTLIQQLNPHFLFNMLNNIRALVLEDPEKARDALAKLSDMLRYSLNETEFNKVSLVKEVTMVNEYLELCKIQFENRLNYDFNISIETKEMLIPRMLLQLCVENAIKHGISKLKQGGNIHISARVENDLLLLDISNPIPEESSSINSTMETKDRGIGLKNIQERIKLLYQHEEKSNQLGLAFEKDKEAKVRITLPVEYELKDGKK